VERCRRPAKHFDSGGDLLPGQEPVRITGTGKRASRSATKSEASAPCCSIVAWAIDHSSQSDSTTDPSGIQEVEADPNALDASPAAEQTGVEPVEFEPPSAPIRPEQYETLPLTKEHALFRMS
jgi:hypothetical protein